LKKLHIFCLFLLAASQPPAPAFSEDLAAFNASVAKDTAELHLAIDQAVHTHPSIAAAKAAASAAGADARAAKWQRFPSFSVEGLLFNQSRDSLQAQAVVDQPLWTGGRISGAIARAEARQSAALGAYNEAILAIAQSTAQSFYEVHRWRERGILLAISLEQHERMVASMERRVAQEVSPLSDLELARARALQISQQIYQAEAQERSALSSFRELVGDNSLTVGTLPHSPASWPKLEDADVTAEALSFSPSLQRLRSEAKSAGAEGRIARASILPQLSGQYSYSENFGHRMGVALKVQSDGGFSRFAAADAANQRVRASELQISAGERQLRDELQALLREYESGTLRLDGSQSAASAAQRVMESYMRQFTSGRRTWLDVMNAVREATSAEIDALDARISAQSSLVRIYLMSGRWTPEPVKSIQP
jgi:adhesin transport system outer membrane protein